MADKTRATAIHGMLKALDDVRADPLPPPWPLSKQQKPIWDEILIQRARDEWQAVDLYYAWQLSDAFVRLYQERAKLDREGSIIESANGPKKNPRGGVVSALQRETIALSRYLRLHPAAAGYEPTSIAGKRQAEAEARNILANGPLDPHGLLPKQ